MSRESINFNTVSPILAGGIFAPQVWDDVLNYSSVLVSLNSIGAGTRLTLYQSPDRVNVSSTQIFNIADGELYTNSFPIYSRFFKLRLDNTTISNQTSLNLQVIFKPLYVQPNNAILKGKTTLWATLASGTGGVSPSLDLSDKLVNTLTIFGNVSAVTKLILQFSSDNITYYDSQYSINITAAGDYGFSVNTSPFFIRVKSTQNAAINTIVNYV